MHLPSAATSSVLFSSWYKCMRAPLGCLLHYGGLLHLRNRAQTQVVHTIWNSGGSQDTEFFKRLDMGSSQKRILCNITFTCISWIMVSSVIVLSIRICNSQLITSVAAMHDWLNPSVCHDWIILQSQWFLKIFYYITPFIRPLPEGDFSDSDFNQKLSNSLYCD